MAEQQHPSTTDPTAAEPAGPTEGTGPSRRGVLRRAGLLGAAVTAGGVIGGQQAAADTPAGESAAPTGTTNTRSGGYLWLTGDHHIHTLYSPDGKYPVRDHVRGANRHGLDWMVVADHGYDANANIGVEKSERDVVAARREFPETLVFHGLEWSIPGAEHGTVILHPGPENAALLREFQLAYDGIVTGTLGSSPENEELARAGIRWLDRMVRSGRVRDALFLAHHPARRGIDSPHEIRNWRDTNPRIAVGMEGAPGHQAAGIARPLGPGQSRGLYGMGPNEDSFAGYPPASYQTHGGFDWMTSTVGGLWDSMLAEGKPWWITANSDSHAIYADTTMVGPDSDFPANGRQDDPVYSGKVDLERGIDFWGGQYSRTHVGATGFGYQAVMDGIRAGRIWVDHGGLVKVLGIRARGAGRSAGLGGTLTVPRGTRVELVLDVTPADRANWAGFVPRLAKLDVIQGAVTGPVADRDTFTTPRTKVVRSYDTSGETGPFRLVYSVGPVEEPLYLRVRGSDGNRTAPGLLGAAVDPAGPAEDVVGDADPWIDLWCYANPIFVTPV